jgi:hypothetical protein
MDNLLEKMQNYDTRHEWDQNFEKGGLVKVIGPNVGLHYIKTKKVAMVSSRDQYVIIARREIPPNQSPSGKRTMVIAGRSKDLDQYPPTPGVVRAQTKISGYWIEEIEPQVCNVHFIAETDFKISLFIQK